jgi:hypothetical protein
MKTRAMVLALPLLFSLFGAGCATVGGLNKEYEEECARYEKMSPQEKAQYDKEHEINWKDYCE